jgi:hypothetical protein
MYSVYHGDNPKRRPLGTVVRLVLGARHHMRLLKAFLTTEDAKITEKENPKLCDLRGSSYCFVEIVRWLH